MLLRSAPHIMWPLRFVMPHDPSMRPAWMIRIGLFLYDHLARREVLPGSRSVDLRAARGRRSRSSREFKRGFVYSDGWVDDARLVVLNALDARARGRRGADAHALRQRAARRRRLDAPARRRRSGRRTVRARAVVNAAGPWAESFLRGVARSAKGEALATRQPAAGQGQPHRGAAPVRARPRLHLPEPRQADHLRDPLPGRLHADRHHRHRAAAATTPAPRASATDEIDYLCTQASRYFEKPVAAGRRGLDLLRRAPAARRRVGRPVGRDARLHARVATPPRRRCCRCGAARSPPSASWPRTRPTRWAACSAKRAPAWTEGAFLAGRRPVGLDRRRRRAPTTTSNASWRRCSARHAVARRRAGAAAGARLRRARRAGARRRAIDGTTWAPRWRPACTSANCATCSDEEWACSGDDVLWRRSKLGLHYTRGEREQVAPGCKHRTPT